MPPPRIGLNLLHAIPQIGGGWDYIQGVLRSLADVDDYRFVVFATKESAGMLPARHGFEVVPIRVDSRNRALRVFAENTRLVAEARRHRLDRMHWFANVQGVLNAVPAIVTTYDLFPFFNGASLAPAKRLYLRTMLRRTASSGAYILPISTATANAWKKQLGVPESRITVVRPVIDWRFRPADSIEAESLRGRLGLPRTFWLYVAHMYPHKNHSRLIEAFRLLLRGGFEPWPLVLRGDADGRDRRAIHNMLGSDLEERVLFLPPLAEEDMPRLYTAATALVFPSLHEGGAMPVIEAMACGCPIVASEIEAIREAAGDAAIYFDPLSATDIAQRIKSCQEDPGRLARGRAEALRRASAYRHDAVLPALMSGYRRACAQDVR